jgi:hypothetical protein
VLTEVLLIISIQLALLVAVLLFAMRLAVLQNARAVDQGPKVHDVVAEIAGLRGLTPEPTGTSGGWLVVARGAISGSPFVVGVRNVGGLGDRDVADCVEVASLSTTAIGSWVVRSRTIAGEVAGADRVILDDPIFDKECVLQPLQRHPSRGPTPGPFRSGSTGGGVTWLTQEARERLMRLRFAELILEQQEITLRLAIFQGYPPPTWSEIDEGIDLVLGLARPVQEKSSPPHEEPGHLPEQK